MAQPGEAIYFDGQSNRKRQVEIRFGGALEIVENGQLAEAWPYGDVRRVDSAPGVLRLMCVTTPGLARLEIRDAALQQVIEAHCRALDVAPTRSQTLKVVVYSAAALASFVGLLVYGIPLLADRLAPLLPLSFERRLGDAVDRNVQFIFRDRRCEPTAAGNAALQRLADQLRQASDLAIPFELRVLGTRVENAFALPGGKVYVTHGLLQKAKNADEVAGVIAHEFGHLQHRDVLRSLIKDGSTGFLLGLLFGDVFGGGAMIAVTRSLLTNSYSRDAERDADRFSVETMHRLGRSPKAMGELLQRIEEPIAGQIPTILLSHPLTKERLATMTQADRPVSGPELLSPTEWAALQNICR
jgi:predicted Zn-dependent protease